MFRFAYANQNTATNASAVCAEAASCCTSQSASCANMSIIMDAIMASILLTLGALMIGVIGLRLSITILVSSIILLVGKFNLAHTE